MDYPKSVPNAGLVGGKFVDEDVVNGTPGSLIPASWGNAITSEVLNVIEAAGLVPDEGDLTQLLQAVRARTGLVRYTSNGSFQVPKCAEPKRARPQRGARCSVTVAFGYPCPAAKLMK